ncbi:MULTISPECIES: class I SAM-dependent methyltransferase [unclassified Paenibacillus]|uniref:Eco57I restriction-modification methylase domain-containing protein n=1 Tax=unclassified Paenibacillus TaxID=185978 RepID=UPI00020D7082|nr:MULTISPECIES: class I SAM-dependent methyltransferase [unclassified Paenibacillus]EGL18180.1 N-6 DNA Methylase [Paenibacillus sp. HGF7]EPD88092.1 hypothetical protein HMPREF1207_02634 [Paenibacillus sp. HGH0039]
MLLKENATAEKLRGGYYTPTALADFITRWGFTDNNVRRVLEPSCGDGAFVESLLAVEQPFSCTAIEIIHDEMIKVQNMTTRNDHFNVIHEDFYSWYRENLNGERYDLVVGNPPYIRYQYLSEDQREEQSRILTSNGMRSNKLINAWVSFVVACVSLLDRNGKIGFVIPAELLQVAYSEDLRNYLMRNLQHITIVTFRELVFEDIEQEVVLLLGEKDVEHAEEHQIRILEFDNIIDLVENFETNTVPFVDIEFTNTKWTRYFLSTKDNVLINEIRQSTDFIQFNEIAEVDIGITTGNNNFFCVDRATAEDYGLIDISRPLIARSVSMDGIYFNEQVWQANVDRGAKAYLLDFPTIDFEQYPEGQRRYIIEGEKRGENTGYKCRIRNRWYQVPSIWTPDAFFLRRNYLYPKFVLNDFNAVSTDTMHRIRFADGIDSRRAILAYYNSITLAFTEIEGRSYGGGVLEILPGEVEKIFVPNLFQIELTDDYIEQLLHLIDDHVKKNDDILGILPEIDSRILVEILNIPMETVTAFRDMWLLLRNRRLQRGRNR